MPIILLLVQPFKFEFVSAKKPILIIQNNTDVTQEVNLFNIRPNLSGNINPPTNAQWDISSQSLIQLTNLQIDVNTPGQSGFTTLTADILTSSVKGIVAALNSLNIGYFYADVVGGNTIISSSNKIFRYGDLTINQVPNNAQWILGGNIVLTSPSVYLAMTLLMINNRTGNVLSFDTIPFAPAPNTLILNDNITYTYSDLSPGDSLQLFFALGPAIPPVTVQISVLQNGLPFYTGPTESLGVSTDYVHDIGNYTLNANY